MTRAFSGMEWTASGPGLYRGSLQFPVPHRGTGRSLPHEPHPFPARFPFHHADQPAGLLKQHPHHEGLQPAAQHGGIHSFHFRNGGLRFRFQLQPAFSRGDPHDAPGIPQSDAFCPPKGRDRYPPYHPGILRLDGTGKRSPLIFL